MIDGSLLDPEAPNALPVLAKREFNEALATHDQVTSRARGVVHGVDEIDVELITTYAAGNAEAVLRLSEHMQPLLERLELSSVMHSIELPLARVLADMER